MIKDYLILLNTHHLMNINQKLFFILLQLILNIKEINISHNFEFEVNLFQGQSIHYH